MKTLRTLSVIVLFTAGRLFAAPVDSSRATVHYDLVQVVDTTQRDAPRKDDIVLFLGTNSSLCTSYSEIQTEERMKEFFKKHPVQVSGMTINWGVPFGFYKDMAANKLTSHAILKDTHYVIPEPIPVQDWKMTTETKTIGGYNCQKATTHFRGRDYEAWFCSDIPYHNGPWKLGGLPGLILEAYDTQKEVVFTFKSFDDTAAPHVAIELPSPTVATTTKDLNRVIEAMQNGGDKLAAGMQVISGGGGNNGQPARRKQYNNQIECDQK